jgi:two-component system, chemotaxis family, chemotaxis protein CheY
MSLNVLVVDDSAVMRSMVLKTLQVAGLELGEMHQASNGQEGLKVLAEHWIDLVFVDINMPVMNGEEMLQALRAQPETRDLPVVVISTEGSRTRIERLEQQGARFVHKPFTPTLVRDLIQQMTGVHHE